MTLSRRAFLRNSAAGAAAVGLAGPGRALACPSPSTKVLEIFCVGGFFHWPMARPIGLGSASSDWVLQNPGVTWSSVAGSDTYAPPTHWFTGLSGVQWGPAAYPLFASGLLNSTRMAAVGHTVEAHEPAVVHALTGSRLGRASACSLGSAVNHHFGVVASGATPDVYSLVLEAQAAPSTLASRVASLSGLVGPAFAPVTVPMSSQSSFNNFRTALLRSQRTDTDALKERYRDRYAQQLTHVTDGRVRSASFDAFDGAVEGLLDHQRLYQVLGMASPTSAPPAWNSATSFTDNGTRGAIHYAIDLLNAGASPVRHIAVMDHGWGGDYDTHNERGPLQSGGNLWNVTRALAQKAGSLGNILVVIHSEFSRVCRDTDARGTEHWPWATAAFFLGGPITTSGLEGSYSMQSNPYLPYEDGLYSPTDMRGVAAWAAGIPDPLGTYFDADLSVAIAGQGGDAAATESVACTVLGPM